MKKQNSNISRFGSKTKINAKMRYLEHNKVIVVNNGKHEVKIIRNIVKTPNKKDIVSKFLTKHTIVKTKDNLEVIIINKPSRAIPLGHIIS